MGAWRPTQDILRFDADFTICLQKRRSRAICRWKSSGASRPGRYILKPAILRWKAEAMTAFFAGLDQSNDRAQLILRLHFVAVRKHEDFALHPRFAWRLERRGVAGRDKRAAAQCHAMRLNMEMTGEYTRVADQGLHTPRSISLFYVCSHTVWRRRQGIRVRARHTPSAAGKGQKGQLAFVSAAKAGNSQTGNRNRRGNKKIQ